MQLTESPDQRTHTGEGLSLEGKYLTFNLNQKVYGIPILKVREIIGTLPVTPLPQSPEHMKGVINLRGKVIPVMDLRTRLGLSIPEDSTRSCIIVVEPETTNGLAIVGMVVDSVNDVAGIKQTDIEQAPQLFAAADTSYILGLAKTADGVRILLDIGKLLDDMGDLTLPEDL